MLKEKIEINNFVKVIFLLLLLPSIYGCLGGGGSSQSGGVGNPIASSFQSNPGSEGEGNPGQQIATIHNPEPITLVLMGSGFAALLASQKRKKC